MFGLLLAGSALLITTVTLTSSITTTTTQKTPRIADTANQRKSVADVNDISWHLIYIFAISDTAALGDFLNVEKTIRLPLDDCFKVHNENHTEGK